MRTSYVYITIYLYYIQKIHISILVIEYEKEHTMMPSRSWTKLDRSSVQGLI